MKGLSSELCVQVTSGSVSGKHGPQNAEQATGKPCRKGMAAGREGRHPWKLQSECTDNTLTVSPSTVNNSEITALFIFYIKTVTA